MEQRTHRGTAELLQSTTPDPETAPAPRQHDRNLPPPPQQEGEPRDLPLVSDERGTEYRRRWERCQQGFVDEPRRAVEQADELVADLIRDLAAQFASERSRLEEEWGQGGEGSTDDLRFALQRYRSFFNRLLRV